MTSQPPPPPFAPAPPVAPPAKGKRRKGMMILGLVVFVLGLVGGGAIVSKAMSNYEEAVKSLARAPVGCTTTLVFDKPATFIMYIETKGKLGDLGGDCEASTGEYEHSGDKLPKVSLTLEDPSGDAVDLQRGVDASYDVAGFVGTGARTVQIEEAGTYHLNVESDESDFAMSIGKNPKKDSEKLTAIGGAVVLAGFVIGLLLFLLGLRRRRPDPAMADARNPVGPLPGWPPGPYAGAPAGPPGAPVQSPLNVIPGQPPTRPPEHPPGGGFAPPTLAPPSPPTPPPPTTGPPTLPPVGTPPVASPPVASPPAIPPAVVPPTIESPPAPSSGGWSIPVDDEERSGDR